MSNIIKKVFSEGTVPILSDEGIRGVIEYYATTTLSRGATNISRYVKTSAFKQHKIEEVNKDEDLLNEKNDDRNGYRCCNRWHDWFNGK